jgi:hypothetical protein
MLAFAYVVELMAVFRPMGRHEPGFWRGLFVGFTDLMMPD